MIGKFDNIKIQGIVSVVPTEVEENEAYYDVLGEKRVKKQTKMTGVKCRHIDDPEHTAADYCITAAKKLLEKITWSLKDIKVMVFVTQNPSVESPSTAFIIQKYLDIPEDCFVFDINLGCSGFVAGLHVVSSLLQSKGEHAKGLVLFCDTQRNPNMLKDSNHDEAEMADRMLFGVCGVAAGLEIVPNSAPIYFDDKSDGRRYGMICKRYGKPPYMNGEAVFEFAINDVVEWVKQFIEETKAQGIVDHDYYSFHQAQKFMLKNVAMVADLDDDKMLYSLEEYGNTSGASVALNLCVNREKIQAIDRSRILLCGFGVGLTCSMMSVEIDTGIPLVLIESDESYPY